MKTITINVSEPVFKAFQRYARDHDRTTSELVREAMATYFESKIRSGSSMRELKPLNLGKVIRPMTKGDDLLEEMTHD